MGTSSAGSTPSGHCWSDTPTWSWSSPPDGAVARLHDLAPRLTFGSDYPTIPHDYATQVWALARLQLSDDALRGVLAGNAAALLAGRVPPSSG